jgi:hypothetical protein
MNELEMLPEKKDKWSAFQKKYNNTSKGVVSIVGANISLFICILLPLFLIGFIWTDFGAPVFGISLLSDGIVTVALFIIGEMMMMRVGADGGKLDAEYTEARKAFTTLAEDVNKLGTMLMMVFCEWQIDVEFNQAITARLRALRMTKEDWEKVKDMKYSDLCKIYGRKKAKDIHALNCLEPVELNEAILMYDDDSDALARGGVPISGEGYIQKKSRSPGLILTTAFTGLLTVSVAITLTSDLSFSRVMYTAFKLVVLLFRMAKGYDVGARAYNTVEVRRLQAKCGYLRRYKRFVNDKTYLKLGDQYGDIACYCTETNE